MSVTLSEVKRAARAHRAALAGESAGYLVLAIADQVLSAPRLVDGDGVRLAEDGALRVASGQASLEAEVELSLRRALDELLEVASSGSAALSRAGRRRDPVGLAALVRELEAALIPVNRAAARRALARLYRETARALASGVLADAAPEVVPSESASEACVERTTTAEIAQESDFSGVLSALREELSTPPQLQDSDPLSSALEVRAVEPAAALPGVGPVRLEAASHVEHELESPIADIEVEVEVEVDFDVDVEGELEAADSSAAPTVMRAVVSEPTVLNAVPTHSEAWPHTPSLGTLVAELPVLSPQQIAAHAAPVEGIDDAWTELMPEVEPMSPAVALVASRRSDVTELTSRFQVGTDPSQDGLGRAIKELAELDLTPAPFSVLSR